MSLPACVYSGAAAAVVEPLTHHVPPCLCVQRCCGCCSFLGETSVWRATWSWRWAWCEPSGRWGPTTSWQTGRRPTVRHHLNSVHLPSLRINYSCLFWLQTLSSDGILVRDGIGTCADMSVSDELFTGKLLCCDHWMQFVSNAVWTCPEICRTCIDDEYRIIILNRITIPDCYTSVSVSSVFIKCSDESVAEILLKFTSLIKTLANAAEIVIQCDGEAPGGCTIATVSAKCEVHMLLKVLLIG